VTARGQNGKPLINKGFPFFVNLILTVETADGPTKSPQGTTIANQIAMRVFTNLSGSGIWALAKIAPNTALARWAHGCADCLDRITLHHAGKTTQSVGILWCQAIRIIIGTPFD
jgi:hypothetical protein